MNLKEENKMENKEEKKFDFIEMITKAEKDGVNLFKEPVKSVDEVMSIDEKKIENLYLKNKEMEKELNFKIGYIDRLEIYIKSRLYPKDIDKLNFSLKVSELEIESIETNLKHKTMIHNLEVQILKTLKFEESTEKVDCDESSLKMGYF